MPQQRSVRQWIVVYLKILIGSALYAAGFQFFLYPNAIATGGVTGIAMIINFFSGFPVGIVSSPRGILRLNASVTQRSAAFFDVAALVSEAFTSVIIADIVLSFWKYSTTFILDVQ